MFSECQVPGVPTEVTYLLSATNAGQSTQLKVRSSAASVELSGSGND